MLECISLATLHDDLDRRLAELREDITPVTRSRARVDAAMSTDAAIYGVNTGFGALADRRIEPGRLAELQRNLVYTAVTRASELVILVGSDEAIQQFKKQFGVSPMEPEA